MIPGTEIRIDDLLDALRKVRVIGAGRFRYRRCETIGRKLIGDLSGLLMSETHRSEIAVLRSDQTIPELFEEANAKDEQMGV